MESTFHQIIKISINRMSLCHFPHDNHIVLLELPSITQHHTLRLIETDHHLPDPSLLTLTCLDHPHLPSTRPLLLDQDEEDSLALAIQSPEEVNEEGVLKRKKTGCTCKKTNCIKMYCECFSVGKMCTEQCGCTGCFNHTEHENIREKAKQRALNGNRHSHRGCNCKKTNCQKKYCECYNAGLACTDACNCCDCCNKEGEVSCSVDSCDYEAS